MEPGSRSRMSADRRQKSRLCGKFFADPDLSAHFPDDGLAAQNIDDNTSTDRRGRSDGETGPRRFP